MVSAHLYPMEKADLPAVIRYNHEVGNTNIVNPMSEFQHYDDVMRAAETFNKTGALLRKEGLKYLYHNHNHEFRTIHGKPIQAHPGHHRHRERLHSGRIHHPGAGLHPHAKPDRQYYQVHGRL